MHRPGFILSDQARQNRDTSNSWMLYQSHRRELDNLLVPERPGLKLCVLGAGNCNDLDLTILLEAYAEVHLVDLDAAALRAATVRQGVDASSRLRLPAPIDLTGAADQFETWSSPPSNEQLLQYIQTLNQAQLPAFGCFDVVLSSCVLSQLINPVRKTIGVSHPHFSAIAAAHRRRHLQLIRHCMNDGGKGVLAIDLISSDRFPQLIQVPRHELPDVMKKIIADQIHYPGLEPDSFRSALQGMNINSIHATLPWIWRLSIRRSFLVYGFTFRKTVSPPHPSTHPSTLSILPPVPAAESGNAPAASRSSS